MRLARILRAAAAALALVVLASGCASSGGYADPRDPLEPMNRAIYGFNEGFDNAIARPVATAYRDVLPEFLRNWVRNFFGNIADIFIGFNNIIQGKPDQGLQDWVRFAFNSTIGIFGINDVATEFGLEKHNEDFGQTFGRWGMGSGPYLVLPFLGSSSVRDGAGTVVDWYADPLGEIEPNRTRNSLVVVRAVGVRADLLEASRLLEEAALDKYVFQRDAYLQRRRSLVYDGRPPREREEEPEKEKAAPADKRSDAGTVNEALPPNVYMPRIPSNYEAVVATTSK